MERLIIAGIVLLLVVIFLWRSFSKSESSLRKKLEKDLEWLKLAETQEGKVMRRSIEDVLKRHDKKEMRIKHKKARNLLKSKVPCYLACQRKGPMYTECTDCTVKHSCMLCKPKKIF